ncbi:MAG: VWA domain-containing protein [Rhodospirillales bacterium]|jgi:hypothetical protein|nr:VWA domain-containing protein [Rhodospirillales bacterium]
MSSSDPKVPAKPTSDQEVSAFLDQVARMPATRPPGTRGRLLFAMDATASRQPTWDRAAQIQGEMFEETAAIGGLEIQLCFYRGFDEFKASGWVDRSGDLLRLMTSVGCRAGRTQIRKALRHAINETRKRKVAALVFVGDCVEEDIDGLAGLAGELGLLGVPAFMFHEGHDERAAFAFREIARLTGGAALRFDPNSPHVLKNLLSAVAVFAAGGQKALNTIALERGGEVRQIAHQVRGR